MNDYGINSQERRQAHEVRIFCHKKMQQSNKENKALIIQKVNPNQFIQNHLI